MDRRRGYCPPHVWHTLVTPPVPSRLRHSSDPADLGLSARADGPEVLVVTLILLLSQQDSVIRITLQIHPLLMLLSQP